MNQIIILAGGKGSRMQSDTPKVLHAAKGIPIIKMILKSVENISERPVVVVGYRASDIISALGDNYTYIHQPEQLGTGHAVWCAKKKLAGENHQNIVVTPGDHPLISERTLKQLLDLHSNEHAKVSLATVFAPHFDGDFASFYNCGRIIRDGDKKVVSIIEFKAASEEQKKISEVNVSYYCFEADWLWENIEKLNSKNIAKEYYLTDMVKIAHDQSDKIASFVIENAYEGLGVNNKEQLERVEAYC
jgi:bifunctional UDP-N-acetylglucosamine pyrophosphorylase/glucosamine-1-phosphate N-acetyltransferase